MTALWPAPYFSWNFPGGFDWTGERSLRSGVSARLFSSFENLWEALGMEGLFLPQSVKHGELGDALDLVIFFGRFGRFRFFGNVFGLGKLGGSFIDGIHPLKNSAKDFLLTSVFSPESQLGHKKISSPSLCRASNPRKRRRQNFP